MTVHSANTVNGWVDAMIEPLHELLQVSPDAGLIGIRQGGVFIAERLHTRLQPRNPLGELDIAFYRDDFARIGLHPVVGPSVVPFSVDDRTIVLIDDVLARGRTVRAAMNEIFDYGRPARIVLAVLAQRAGHELPIRADIIGAQLDVPHDSYIEFDSATGAVTVGMR
jgi:pyrimidine operon attenuation protein/uracil phosphoribosyltransferase